MSGDPHGPTSAGPAPAGPAAQTTAAQPAGSVAAGGGEGNELPFGIPPDRPEILVGAAFAGGFLAAFILKRFGGD